MAKILFLAMNLNSGGAERQMVNIACALKRRGHNVSFICYDEGDFFLPNLSSVDISVTWIIEKRMLPRMIKIRRFIRRGNYDTVISFLETPNILNAFAAIGGRSWRVIAGERSAKLNNIVSRRGRIMAKLFHYADVIVCNSENAAHMWRINYPHLSHKLHVIYNLIILNTASVTGPSQTSDETIRLVVAASYQYLKNPLNLVDAVAQLSVAEKKRLKVDWYGNMVAIPSAYPEVEAKVRDYGLEKIISLHGPIKEIHKEMYSSDLVGLFSSVEGLPNAICEAMSMGKPIIMSAVSDYKALVDGNGLICNGNSPQSIKECLSKILFMPKEQLRSMGVCSQNIASKLFNSSRIIDQWESLI